MSVTRVSWPSLSTIACLKPFAIGASSLARKRVPSSTPSAPRASAAARPRPSATPPAASTGIGATALTTIGTSGIVPIVPMCPPPSVPWATITSAPARAAAFASATVETMCMKRAPSAWARET